MSYEIIKSINVDIQNMKVYLNHASNNVFPKTFENTTIDGYGKYRMVNDVSAREQFVYSIVEDFIGGMMQARTSVSDKFRYAMIKTQDVAKQLGNGDAWNCLGYDVHQENEAKYIQQIAQTFITHYQSPNKREKACIRLNDGMYIKAINRKQGKIYTTPSINDAKVYKTRKSVYIDNQAINYDTQIVKEGVV